MKELKTLKDLEIGCLSRDILKQEAIKWVKVLGTKKYNEVGYPEARMNIKWIKHFFNITKEDLEKEK